METMGIMDVTGTTLVLMLLNLVILTFILKKFLYKPVKNMMDQRQAEVAEMYDNAEKAMASAQSMKTEYETRLENAKNEASDIVSKATRKAQVHSEEIISDAKKQAFAIISNANIEIEHEKKKAVNEIKNDISSLAVAVASKVVEKEISQKDHEKLIESFIENVGELQ